VAVADAVVAPISTTRRVAVSSNGLRQAWRVPFWTTFPRTELNRAVVQFEDDSAGQVVFEVDRDVVCMPGSSGSL